ncbi:MAG: hypothetical protein U1F83_16110 [Verrucomicrobiota bacterium]
MSSRLILLCWLCLWSPAFALELLSPPTMDASSSNVVIHWRTDSASGTRAQVVPPGAKVSVPDKTPGTEHTVVVSGLQPGVGYSVAIGSARVWLATNKFTATGTPPFPPSPAVSAGKPNFPEPKAVAPPTRKTWGNLESLPDHFARHGADFRAKDQDDYARQAWEFLQRAKAEGLPAKVDDDGVLRVFDPKSGAFASYNRDGTTKTFFKPNSRGYFERQPGKLVNVKLESKK